MNRRQFGTVLAGLTGAARARAGMRHIALEAIVAQRTPQFLVINGIEIASDDPRLFELRVYEEAAFHVKPQSTQRKQIRSFLAIFASLREPFSPDSFTELVLQDTGSRFDEIFRRAGIHPLLSGRSLPGGDLTYLIPFDSLAERQAAWTAFNADPEWGKIRREVGRVSEVAIYRRYPGGRIFEMSL